MTPRGTTYNAYLILDEKITLIDTVKAGFEHEMMERIKGIIDPKKIDYVICQHAEPDHSGAMPELMKEAANAKVIATQAGKDILWEHFHNNWDAQIVKTGDNLNLGKKTLNFVEAKMLHWPDNMFTYIKEDGILFSNDVFGGNIVEVLHVGGGELACCGQPMELQMENTVDASKEKHVPIIEKTANGILIKIGSVPHPMEEKHYIMWIEAIINGKYYRKFLKPGDKPEAEFEITGEKISAREYCNLHGL